MSKVEHPYSDVNEKRPSESFLYQQADVHWGHIENYTITQKLGRGKYAHVFEGNDRKHKKKVAVKVLLPIKP